MILQSVNFANRVLFFHSDTPSVVLHAKRHIQNPHKPPCLGVARRQWPFPCQALQQRQGGLWGFPPGEAQSGHPPCCASLEENDYSYGIAPCGWPLCASLKVPFSVQHYTSAALRLFPLPPGRGRLSNRAIALAMEQVRQEAIIMEYRRIPWFP